MTKISKEQKQELIQLYKNGVTPKQLGSKYGIYNNSVTRILRKAGVERNQLIRVSQDKINQIIELYNNKTQVKIIAAKFDLDDGTVCRILKKNGIILRPGENLRRKYQINQDFFKNLDNESTVYYLGFFYADACLSHNQDRKRYSISITLHPQDRYILQKLSNLIYGFDKTQSELKKDEDGNTREYFNLTFWSKIAYNDLVRWGCVPQKSHKITFPEHLISDEMMPHFIRGYLDGDGCVSDNNDRTVVDVVSTETFLLRFKDWAARKLNIKFGALQQRHKERDNNTRSMRVSSFDDFKTLLGYVYKNATLYLTRKFDVYADVLGKKNLQTSLIEKKKSTIDNYSSDYVHPYKETMMTKEYIKNLPQEEKIELANYLTSFYSDNGFPYYNLSSDELIKQFSQVRATDSNSICIDNNTLTIFNNIGSNICKYFAPHFFEVKSGVEPEKPSMLEAFNNPLLLQKVILNRLNQPYIVNGNQIRQGLTNSNIAFKSSSFNVMIAKYIYSKFTKENDIIYDYSMGFGQRLLASLTLPHKVTYIGVDPLLKSVESNINIIDFYKQNIPGLKAEAHLSCIGSEHFKPQEYANKVDLAFSSPPYFNHEIYCNDTTQAYANGYSVFINNWWRKTVQNARFLIKNNGLFLLNIKEKIGSFDLKSDMLAILAENDFNLIDTINMRLTKNLSFRNANKEQPKHKYEPIFILQLNKGKQ